MNKEPYQKAYDIMCVNCMYEKRCHEECISCEEFDELLEEMEGGGIDE